MTVVKPMTVAKPRKHRILIRFGAVVLRTPKYALLAANLGRDVRLSGWLRGASVASIGYALSPIDFVPGLIPVLGQLDDMAVLIGGLRGVLRNCPPDVARDHLKRSGLEMATMDQDLGTLGEVAIWIGKGAISLLGKASATAVRAISWAVVSRISRRDSAKS